MKHNLFVQHISTLVCGRCGKDTVFNKLLYQHKYYSCDHCGYTVQIKSAHKHKMIIDKRL